MPHPQRDPPAKRLRLIGGVNGTPLFNATAIPGGKEPWVSDGTPGWTSLLADIVPSSALSSPDLSAKLGSDDLFFTYVLSRPGRGGSNPPPFFNPNKVSGLWRWAVGAIDRSAASCKSICQSRARDVAPAARVGRPVVGS